MTGRLLPLRMGPTARFACRAQRSRHDRTSARLTDLWSGWS
jgi:hypothetical protein